MTVHLRFARIGSTTPVYWTLLVATMACIAVKPGAGLAEDLYQIPAGVQTRWASPENWKGEKGAAGQLRGGRKGSPAFTLKASESKTLAEVQGQSGTVRRFWITMDDRSARMLRGVKLEMFWDGAEESAVAAPLGDFFCQGLGRMAAFENALFASAEGRNFYCCVPMPFRKGMKIVVTNESGKDLNWFFYDVDYTVGDRHDKDMLYFHANWRRENPTTPQKDFEILPRVAGRGRYLGACLSVIPDQKKYLKTWWGEGEAKIYLDGDRDFPTLCGTGTEDYIGTAYGQGQFFHKHQGCQIADREDFQYAFYRLHIPDPVWFHKDCRVTIQQLGGINPAVAAEFQKTGETYHTQSGEKIVALPLEEISKANTNRRRVTPEDQLLPAERLHETTFALVERQDDWAACAWFYLDKPTNGLPALAPASERIAGLAVGGKAAKKAKIQ